eukprot:10962611-Heterocapsa_arctica.AAC.1
MRNWDFSQADFDRLTHHSGQWLWSDSQKLANRDPEFAKAWAANLRGRLAEGGYVVQEQDSDPHAPARSAIPSA